MNPIIRKVYHAIQYLLNDQKSFELKILSAFFEWLPDRIYVLLRYRAMMGRPLNLSSPQRFTEKLQWLKLYYRIPLLTTCVDKCEAKKYAASIIGNNHIIPTLGVWDNFEDIDFDSLPNQFVLKTTNGGGGGGVVICKDKNAFDKDKAMITLTKSLKSDIYKSLREWPYKNVNKRIIAEEYKEDKNGELRDYKFFCFNGQAKVMLVASNRFTTHNFNYMDMDFNPLPIISKDGLPNESNLDKPQNFEKMKEIVQKLCAPFPHVRVDVYSCNGEVYFGELTFFDSSGYDNLNSDYWDLEFGSWLTLPPKTL